MKAAEGAIKQIGLKGSSQLTARDRELIGNYQRLEKRFPDAEGEQRLAHQQELGHHDADGGRHRATRSSDPSTGPDQTPECGGLRSFSVCDRETGDDDHSTGVQAVSEGNYGRTDEALWYVGKIARRSTGSLRNRSPR